MSEIKRIPFSASIATDPWADLEDDKAADLLQHLQSDNLALRRLRDALWADMETTSLVEPAHG